MFMDKNWHAVYTKARHEKRVDDRLSREGVESFLPLVKKLSRWKDRKKLVRVPLFPGYLFVRIDANRRIDVTHVKGVVKLLGPGPETPSVVPEETIQALKKMLSSNVPVDTCPYLKRGRRVRVTRGPLKGLEGALERRKGVFRVVVSVPIVGRSASAEVDTADIETA